MKNRARILLLLLVACLSLGCSVTEKILPNINIDTDYVFFPVEHYNLEYDDQVPTFLSIPLYSAEPIYSFELVPDEHMPFDVEVYFIDSRMKAELLGTTDTEETIVLPFYLYQTILEKDWDKYAQMQIEYWNQNDTGSGQKDHESLLDQIAIAQDEFLHEYRIQQENDTLPKLYSYEVAMQITLKESVLDSAELTTLTFLINGKEKVVSMGRIRIDRRIEQSPQTGEPKLFNLISGALETVPISNKGEYRIGGPQQFYLLTNEDIEILSFRPKYETSMVEEINIQVFSSDGVDTSGFDYDSFLGFSTQSAMDFLWKDDNTVSLHKGQLMTFYLTGSVPQFAKDFYGFVNQVMEITYRDAEGNIYSCETPFGIQKNADPFEYYLLCYSDTDVMAYYRDYYDVLTNSEHGILILSIDEE